MSAFPDNDLKEWIAECLLNNVQEAFLVKALSEKGLGQADIYAHIVEAKQNPYFKAGLKVAQKGQRIEWLLRVYEYTQSQSAFAGQLERHASLTPSDFLERYYSANRPVILTDLMCNWKAGEKWTPAYLKERFGNLEVEYLNYSHSSEKSGFANKQSLFSEFIDHMNSVEYSNEFYMTAYNTHKHKALLDGLLEDIEFFPGLLNPDLADDRVFLWMGPAGTTSGLHIDPHNILLAQVQGRKKVRLIPSYHLPHVYLDNDFFSPVNPEAFDTKQYPMFQYAPIIEITLVPGEVLFIPVAWWHQVRALDTSISLSFTNFVFKNSYAPISQVFKSIPD